VLYHANRSANARYLVNGALWRRWKSLPYRDCPLNGRRICCRISTDSVLPALASIELVSAKEAELTKFFTLGYEVATVADFILTLQNAGVSLLLDVRELPQSRRPGFSKRALAEALANVGIGYRHMKQLGDPKSGRDAARRGDMDAFRTIFGAHLELEATQAAIDDAAAVVEREIVALMCFERAPKNCHRSIVADRIGDIVAAEIVHLGVQPGRSTVGAQDGGTAGRIA
jgi:hypothetical protein